MSDIVERLRRGVLTRQERRSTELEAADEIWKLRVDCGIKSNDIEELQLQIEALRSELARAKQKVPSF